MLTANTPAQAPPHGGGSLPKDESNRKRAKAASQESHPTKRRSQPLAVRGRKENELEISNSPAPRKKSQRTPRHMSTAPAASMACSVIRNAVGLFVRGCITVQIIDSAPVMLGFARTGLRNSMHLVVRHLQFLVNSMLSPYPLGILRMRHACPSPSSRSLDSEKAPPDFKPNPTAIGSNWKAPLGLSRSVPLK